MLHINARNSDPVVWPGQLPAPRRVIPAVVGMLLDDLGDHLINERGHTVGPIPDDQRTRVLNTEVVPFFGEALSATLSEHDDRALLRYLIRANEALLRQARIEENVLPSRLACFGPQSDEVENFAKDMVETTISAVSSRFVIEFLAGNPAVGSHETTTEGYDRMLALASELTNKGFLSDAIYAEISNATVSVLPSRRLGIGREDDRWISGLRRFLSSHASTTLDAVADANGNVQPPIQRPDDDPAPDGDFAEANRLAEMKFGFTFTDLTNFVGQLVDVSIDRDQHDVGELRRKVVLDKITRALGWELQKTEHVLVELSMRKVANFWKLGNDVRPWRYNRTRSYLRKPLIVRGEAEDEYIVFGNRNTLLAPLNWYGQYTSGRLQAKTAEMKTALNGARDRKGDRFEGKVETELRHTCDSVRRRNYKIGKHDLRKIDGLNLGDLDLVAYHRQSRTLFLIEAKALEVARTPAELRNEITNILEGDHSAVERLRGRVDWVQRNMDAVRLEFALPVGKITITPTIVIDADLMTRQFDESPFQIVPIGELTATINQTGTAPRTRQRRRRNRRRQ